MSARLQLPDDLQNGFASDRALSDTFLTDLYEDFAIPPLFGNPNGSFQSVQVLAGESGQQKRGRELLEQRRGRLIERINRMDRRIRKLQGHDAYELTQVQHRLSIHEQTRIDMSEQDALAKMTAALLTKESQLRSAIEQQYGCFMDAATKLIRFQTRTSPMKKHEVATIVNNITKPFKDLLRKSDSDEVYDYMSAIDHEQRNLMSFFTETDENLSEPFSTQTLNALEHTARHVIDRTIEELVHLELIEFKRRSSDLLGTTYREIKHQALHRASQRLDGAILAFDIAVRKMVDSSEPSAPSTPHGSEIGFGETAKHILERSDSLAATLPSRLAQDDTDATFETMIKHA